MKVTNKIAQATIDSILAVESLKGEACDNLVKLINSKPSEACRKQFEGALLDEAKTAGLSESSLIIGTRALIDCKTMRTKLGLGEDDLGYTVKAKWTGGLTDRKYLSVSIQRKVKAKKTGAKTPSAPAKDGEQVKLKKGALDWNNMATWNDLDLALARLLAAHDRDTVLQHVLAFKAKEAA